MNSITRVLAKIDSGDSRATDELLPLVYQELRQLASAKIAGEKPGQTLQPTALVHEAYVRLVDGSDELCWDSRGHFFAAAATAMRRILVDNARRKASARHGGGRQRLEIDSMNEPASVPRSEEWLALDEALQSLADKDPRKAALVELRCFAGLSNQKAASCLGISTATAERDWAYARAWLHQRMIAG